MPDNDDNDQGPIDQMNEEMREKTPLEAIGDDFGGTSSDPRPTDDERQALDEKVEKTKERGA